MSDQTSGKDAEKGEAQPSARSEPEGEDQPLLGSQKKGTGGRFFAAVTKMQAEARAATQEIMVATHLDNLVDHEQNRVINYDAVALSRPWGTFFYVGGTVLSNEHIWKVMGQLLFLALVIAAGVVLLSKDPTAVKTDDFAAISAFLKVFVAFLLGFFMSSSVARWNSTVKGFLILVNAVKNLQMQLLALGVRQEEQRRVVRYGVLSMGFLIQDFELEHLSPEEKKKEQKERDRQRKEKGFLFDEEQERLEKVDDRASLMWTWVACYMSSLAEQGMVPPMASPTYGRIVALAQEGQVGIRTVRTSVGVQMPFVYAHLLAVMVHLNNVLCMISLGLILGVAGSEILLSLGYNFSIHGPPKHPGDMSKEGAVHNILIAFLTQGAAPLMYQSFLQIALALSHPFGPESKFAKIPTDVWLHNLRRDCAQAELMASDPPSWQVAHFKK